MARRILQRLDGMGKWGGYHTEFAHLARGFAGNERALAEAVGEALLAPACWRRSRASGQRHMFLNPRRAGDIHALIERGEAPRRLRVALLSHCESPVPTHPEAFHGAHPRRGRHPAPDPPDKALRIATRCAAGGRPPPPATPPPPIRDPDATAIIDELGTLTFARSTGAPTRSPTRCRDAGVKEGDGVAIMCRNHRGFIDATVACSKLGAHALYLNTAFAGPQITESSSARSRSRSSTTRSSRASPTRPAQRRKRFIAWHDGGEKPKDPLLEDLIDAGDPADVVPPDEKGRV